MARPDRTTLVAFIGVVLFGGLNAIAVKQTVAELDPFWGAGSRFLAAGLIFLAIVVVRRRPIPRGRPFVGAMAYGAVGFAAAFGLIYPGLQRVPAGTASVVLALSPLATYALAVVQRQERLQGLTVIGGVIALAGVGIVFADQMGAAVPLGSLALVAGGMVCLSESGVIAKAIPRSDPFATNAIGMLTAGAVLTAVSFLAGEAQAVPARTTTWLAVGYIVVFGSVALFGLYLRGLQRWSASAMSYTTLLLPLVSVSAATVLTGEHLSPSLVIGGVVIVAGVYLGAFQAPRPRRSTATSMPECLPTEDCAESPRRA
ncbi:MAG TPA: EamA family transporter, partial [Candidatus Limnocylindrales bacterium]|nr:EamA family transporter [Candidatus Limnocylindrales bacterium]